MPQFIGIDFGSDDRTAVAVVDRDARLLTLDSLGPNELLSDLGRSREDFISLYEGTFDLRYLQLAQEVWKKYQAASDAYSMARSAAATFQDSPLGETRQDWEAKVFYPPSLSDFAALSYSEAQEQGFSGSLTAWRRELYNAGHSLGAFDD